MPLKVFGCQISENIVKISVLDRLYGQKRVNYLTEEYCKNTLKNNVLEGYLACMFELASGSGTWKN